MKLSSIYFAWIIKQIFKVEPEPGQSDGSGFSQIPRLRLRNPAYNVCYYSESIGYWLCGVVHTIGFLLTNMTISANLGSIQEEKFKWKVSLHASLTINLKSNHRMNDRKLC